VADVTNYTIENASGASVRTDLNNVFAAIQSSNSKSTDLASSQCVAGMLFLNTSGSKILKIRNSSNNGFTEIGSIDSANLGLLPRAGGTMTGQLLIDDSSSASSPALSFDSDSDTGFFRVSANKIGVSAAGSQQMFFNSDGITLNDQNEVRFTENSSNGTNYVSLKATASVTENRAITLPNETGTLLTSASSIANSNLANSSVTVGNTSISLGASATTINGIATLVATNVQSTDLNVTNILDPSGNNGSTPVQLAQGRAKAWVNFDGTFGTSPFTEANGGIRNAFNVSSVVDDATGRYTINFASALANSNYCVATMAGNFASSTTSNTTVNGDGTRSTTAFKIRTVVGTNNTSDKSDINVAFFGD
jgi:hypothetical protein